MGRPQEQLAEDRSGSRRLELENDRLRVQPPAQNLELITDGYLTWFGSGGVIGRSFTQRREDAKFWIPAFATSRLCVRAENSHATQVAQFKKFSQPKTQEFGALDIGHDSGTSNP
jgi:hypothetical protein